MVRHPAGEKLRLPFDGAGGNIFRVFHHTFAIDPDVANAAATREANFSFKRASQGETNDEADRPGRVPKLKDV